MDHITKSFKSISKAARAVSSQYSSVNSSINASIEKQLKQRTSIIKQKSMS